MKLEQYIAKLSNKKLTVTQQYNTIMEAKGEYPLIVTTPLPKIFSSNKILHDFIPTTSTGGYTINTIYNTIKDIDMRALKSSEDTKLLFDDGMLVVLKKEHIAKQIKIIIHQLTIAMDSYQSIYDVLSFIDVREHTVQFKETIRTIHHSRLYFLRNSAMRASNTALLKKYNEEILDILVTII